MYKAWTLQVRVGTWYRILDENGIITSGHAQALCLRSYALGDAVCRSRGLNQRGEATRRILIKYVDGARGRVTGGAARTLSAPRSASLIILDFISREESEVISPVILRASVPRWRPGEDAATGNGGRGGALAFISCDLANKSPDREHVV